MDKQWYVPLVTGLLGLGLFWTITTPIIGAAVYPRRLLLPRLMRWSYQSFPAVMGPNHRIYVILGGIVLEAFPIALWVAGYTPNSPFWFICLAGEVSLSAGWVAALLYYARRGR